MRDLIVLAEGREARRFRQTRPLGWHRATFRIRHKSPNVSVPLRTWKAPRVDSRAFQFGIFCERRYEKPLAGVRFKLPAMIGAFDSLAIELPKGKRKRTVRANVPQRERLT